MKLVTEFTLEILWLAGAAGLLWLSPKTVLTIEGIALLITISLWMVERRLISRASPAGVKEN